jgi:hypothetical protein
MALETTENIAAVLSSRIVKRYTYLNSKTGQEFSGVLGFTYNLANTQTQYQNGVDMHFDWGASQFLTKQFQVGVVGYISALRPCAS